MKGQQGTCLIDIWSSYGEILILGHQIADLQACLREENLYHSRLTQLFLEVGNQVFPVSVLP